MNATATENFIIALEANTGERARRNGKGWSARCPAHDDRRPSLSISEGDGGRCLLRCHAGCDFEDICLAAGVTAADLMPANGSAVYETSAFGEKQTVSSTHDTEKGYESAADAIRALERQRGSLSARWTYHDKDGSPVGIVVRWNTMKGKLFRPVHRDGHRWFISGMSEPRPLYRLPELAGADRVYITEGEKSVEAAREIGLIATTSSHGSNSPDKTDWSPLAGKECIILPDNDQAGSKYAEVVTGILARLTPPPNVKVVVLPNLSEGGDIVDWMELREGDAAADDLRQQVEALATKADVIEQGRESPQIERFQPFPIDALPEPVCGFVQDGARAIGCDASFLALPLLTALGAAIGNTRRIQLKRGWTAPTILWSAIIGESGNAKTPAFKLAMQPIHDRQHKSFESHSDEMATYESALASYDKTMSAWKKDRKTEEPPPTKPVPPQAERFIVSDTTVEALAPILLFNPRGVLLARDELSGWLGSFDRYSGGSGGGDAAHWLSMFNGENIMVDRKTGNPRTIRVPQASVWVTGGIQPAVLHRALGTEHRESGLAARVLFAWPPRKPKRWTDADIDPSAVANIRRLVDRLYDLQSTVDDEGNLRPFIMGLTREAIAAWIAFYDGHNEEQVDLVGELSAAWSKLEEYAARLALVIHCVRCAADDPTVEGLDVVDVASMEAGIRLAQWFKGEARRVYSLLSESEGQRRQRSLFEWIERKGGSVTARQVQQGNRKYRTSPDAEAALNELVKAGHGRWEDLSTTANGGRPSRVFRLTTPSTVYETPTQSEKPAGCVDVDTPDRPTTVPDDEWGEL